MNGNTPRRTVRIEDGLWEEAQRIAKARGDNLSDILRQALETYVKDNQEEAR